MYNNYGTSCQRKYDIKKFFKSLRTNRIAGKDRCFRSNSRETSIMVNNIKKLLSKNSWTGKEVGKALLMSLQRDIERKDNPKLKPLFSQDDLNRMMDGLDTDEKYAQFKIFSVIYSAIVDSFNLNQAQIQQFYNGYYRYLYSIKEAERAENYYNATKQFPLILTQSQYNRILKEELEKKKADKISFYLLFFNTLRYFLRLYHSDNTQKSIPTDIKIAFDQAQKEPPNNKRHLEEYNIIWAEDYYLLEDGTRLNIMSTEKWEELFEKICTDDDKFVVDIAPDKQLQINIKLTEKGTLYAIKLLYGGTDAIKKTYKEKIGEELQDKDIAGVKQALEELVDNITNSNLSDTKKTLALFYDPPEDKKWHYYQEFKKKPTNYNLIKQILEDCKNDKIPRQKIMKEFKDNYPSLYTAIKFYIEKNIPSTKKLKANQFYDNTITLEELTGLPFTDYKLLTSVNDADIIFHYMKECTTSGMIKTDRALYHGIAIIKSINATDIDMSGNYIDPIESNDASLILRSLDYLEKNPEETEEIEQMLNILALPALCYMYAYNDFIDIITAAYGVEFIAPTAKYDLSRQEKQIEDLNNMIYMLYANVYETAETTTQEKRKFMQETFKPINLDDLKPTEESKQNLRKQLDALGYSKKAVTTIKHFRSLIETLARR